MQKFFPLVLVLFLLGCTQISPRAPTLLPPSQTTPLATATTFRAPPTRTATVIRATATLVVPPATPTIFPTPFAGELQIVPRANLAASCDFDFAKLDAEGFEQLAYVPTGDCLNGELGLFQIRDKTYIAQSGLFGAAFTITDVTNPSAPQIIGIWDWQPQGATLDLKTFKQGERRFLAMGLQRGRQGEEAAFPCGIGIVEVTNVRAPKFITRIDGRTASPDSVTPQGDAVRGNTVGAPEPWCNVHSLEIDTDEQGNATFFIVSDVDTYGARAVDIRDLENPRETNSFHLHAHPHTAPNRPVLNYVHDSFVAPDRIYLANWLAGVVILDKQKFERGEPQEGTIIKPTENVAPGGFHVHYVAPIANGDFIFVEDELNADNGLRLLDIRDPRNPKTLWTETNEGGVNAPHNFVLRDNLLFVGWYNDGIKVFEFNVSDPNNASVKQVAFQKVRASKIISRERYFDGVWGARVNDCTVKNVKRICVYASDMTKGLMVLALEE